MRTLEIVLPRDLQQAGMPDEHLCAWGYYEGLRNRVDQIHIVTPGGWQRTYSMQEVRAMLRQRLDVRGVVNMGARRSLRLRKQGMVEPFPQHSYLSR